MMDVLAGDQAMPGRARQTSTEFPLSVEQRLMWLHAEVNGDPRAYTLQLTYALEGRVDPDALRAALDGVVRRHEALRTGFRLTAEGLVQEIRKVADCPVELATAPPGLDEQSAELHTREWLAAAAARPFELDRPPLLRVHLLRLAPQRHVLLILVHHLVFDGWSAGLLLAELSADYRGLTVRREEAQAPAAGSFRRHVLAEAARLAAGAGARNLGYWTARLTPPPGRPPLVLEPAGTGAELLAPPPAEPFALGAEASDAVRRLADEFGTTEFVVTAALLACALNRLHGPGPVHIGYPTSTRGPEEEGTIGLFLNTLVLVVDVRDEMTLAELVLAVETAHYDALDHRPLEADRVAAAVPAARAGGDSLYQVMLAFQNLPPAVLDLPGVLARPLAGPDRAAEFDLAVSVEATAPVLAGWVERDGRSLTSADTRTLLAALDALACGAVVVGGGGVVGGLSVLGVGDVGLVARVNGSVGGFGFRGLAGVVAGWGVVAGGSVAVCGVGGVLSFGELDVRAGLVAAGLVAAGVGRGDVVGVAVGRGVDLVVALLGVWRAGAAFVPLDVEYPVERLRLMVGDCGPGVVLGDAGGLSWLEGSGVRVLSVGEVEGLGVAAGGGVCVEVGPEELAYVMYTSGSTGRPKGVMVPHGAISNVVQAFQERIGCAPGDTLHAVTSISFDIALLELFWPLAVGARVQLGTPSEAGGPGSAAAPHRVTHFQCTPTLAAAIVEDPAWRLLLRGVKYVLLGGEPVPGHLVHTIQQAFDCEVFNVYGPTEATVWCTARRITGPEDAGLVGGLLANCQAFVVDGVGRLVPPGVRGELWVGGAGLALGYWGRPDLTAERFVSGVVVGAGRLYRTGDVVSLGGDGLFRFHGRVDDQVKVRGHRVELGEVDAALVAHPGVRAGAAVVVGGRLVGCVVPVAGWGGGLVGGVRRFVAGVLPGGSVPGSVVVVEGLPVTVNGKTDRRALAGLVASVVGVEVVGESSAVVGGSVVEVLAGLWRRVLGVAELDWSVGFQQHGGDSLKAIQAAAQARTRGIALTAATLLRADSLAEAARAAAALDPAATGLVRPDRTSSGPLPLLPMQHDFFARPRPDHNWANLAGLFRPDEADPVDEHRLGAALRLVARRHEALRLAFTAPSGGTGEWRQTLVPEPRVAVESRELDCAGADVRTVIEAEARSQQRTIDLVRGPVAKVVVLRVRGEARPRILVIAHHLVMDAWSWQAFLSELACTYAKLTSSPSVDGPPADDRPPGTQFGDWARTVEAEASDPGVADEVRYWESLSLSRVAPVPRDLTAGRNTAGTARTVERALDAAATTRLLEPHSWADGATTQELLLTAFAAAYGDWSGAPTTALRMLHHGRHGLGTGGDLRSTLGWLSIDYPLVLPTAAAPGQTLLARVRDRLAATPRHGYGYGILRHLAAEPLRRRMRSLPTPEINFNYLGREDVAVPRPGQWRPAEERITDRFSPQEDRGSVLQLRIFVRRGRLVLELQYSESLHRSRTVASLADGFARQLTALLPPR